MNDLGWLTRRPIAHRGLHDGNKKVWENTLAAFELAIDADFSIECDVQLSGDNEVIVFHDTHLSRLTREKGQVRSRTTHQLTSYEIGTTLQRIPTLQNMLNAVAGRVPVLIELKGAPGYDKHFLQVLANGLSGYNGHYAVMSFDHHLIRKLKRYLPNVPAGLTAEGLKDEDMESHFSMLAHDIDFVSYNVHHLENRFVRFVRDKLAMPVISWTVRTNEDLARTMAYADQATFELMHPGM